MIRPSYNCTQQELYSVCRVAWKSCDTNLVAFANFKSKYDTAFILDKLTAITDASELPDDQARTEESEILRGKLVEKAIICTGLFQSLKRYIVDAYPDSEHKTRFDAAGQGYYEKATNQNWESVVGLNTAASKFIASHLADLTANDNMPLAFQAKFELARQEFEALNVPFFDEEGNSPVGTQAKITANNGIHASLMKMLLDGQDIFKDDEAMKKKFVFQDILSLVSGSSASGVKGYLIDSATDFPIAGVKVSIKGTTKSATSDNEGRYEILQLAAGIYTLTYEKAGYETLIVKDHEVKTGVTGMMNQFMTPVPLL